MYSINENEIYFVHKPNYNQKVNNQIIPFINYYTGFWKYI